MEEIVVVSASSLIDSAFNNNIAQMANKINSFTTAVKSMLIDGVDYGMIPGVDKPCLFKAGAEKIQYLLGLTPQYTLLDRCYEPMEKNDKGEVTKDSYYRYEFMCSLYRGDIKVAEGVGTANTREKKYVSQAKYGTYPDDLCNTVMKIAKKRAFLDAIVAVACISDMFTQDLEDNETIKKMKVDKKTKVGKVTIDDVKALAMEAWKNGVSTEGLQEIMQSVNSKYQKSTDIDKKDYATILALVQEKGKK